MWHLIQNIILTGIGLFVVYQCDLITEKIMISRGLIKTQLKSRIVPMFFLCMGGAFLTESLWAFVVFFTAAMISLAPDMWREIKAWQEPQLGVKGTSIESFFELLSMILPPRTREQVFNPGFEDLKSMYLRTRKYRKPGQKRWLKFCFAFQCSLHLIDTIRVGISSRTWDLIAKIFYIGVGWVFRGFGG